MSTVHRVRGDQINNEEVKNYSKFQLGIVEGNNWETRAKLKLEMNANINIYIYILFQITNLKHNSFIL